MGALQYISTSALSLTLSGNTGVAPFLTLFLVGVIEKSDPTLLYMDGWVEKIIASWPGIVVFGILTVLEFVGKCVPVVDEIIDSAMAFVVPIFSVMGSLASHGLFTAPASASEGPHGINDDGTRRRLEKEEDNGKNGVLTFLQVVLSTVGVVLALLVHLCKMLLRLVGEGCCTCCITTAEIMWVGFSVTICIFIVPIAIGAAILLGVAAGFGFKSWWEKRQKKKAGAEATAAGGGTGGAIGGTAGRTAGGINAKARTGQDTKESKSGDEEQGNQKSATVSDGLDSAEPSKNPEYNPGKATAPVEEISNDNDKLQPLLSAKDTH